MLLALHIRDFTTIRSLALDFAAGLTVITGETGAGKSIMLDALGLALGDRAGQGVVRPEAERADISAEFDLSALPRGSAWLAKRELTDPDDQHQCVLRRVLAKEGRSRAFINGQPVTLADLRSLGELLVDMHSQHEHLSLLRRDEQRRLLDACAGNSTLVAATAQAWDHWQDVAKQQAQLAERVAEQQARRQLLQYQAEELELLAPQADEADQLGSDQQRLAHAKERISAVDQVLAALQDDNSLIDQLRHLGTELDIDDNHSALAAGRDLLASALIHLEEGASEVRRYGDALELDPERLQQVETRLEALHDMARKHRINARELPALAEQVQAELLAQDDDATSLASLDQALAAAEATWHTAATSLGQARRKAATPFAKAVNSHLKQLGMAAATLELAFEPRAGRDGLEAVEFLVRTNPDLPQGPLAKVASGGELSRLALAIQAVAAASTRIPCLVLDEVDVGVGGQVADTVGRMLEDLATRAQVLCVTHQPQVAARGSHHLVVQRSAKGTLVTLLSATERQQEVARMLAGKDITDAALAHAAGLLAGDQGPTERAAEPAAGKGRRKKKAG